MHVIGHFLISLSLMALGILMILFPAAIQSVSDIGRDTWLTHCVVAVWGIWGGSFFLLLACIFIFVVLRKNKSKQYQE